MLSFGVSGLTDVEKRAWTEGTVTSSPNRAALSPTYLDPHAYTPLRELSYHEPVDPVIEQPAAKPLAVSSSLPSAEPGQAGPTTVGYE